MSGKLKTLFPGRACGGGQAFLPVTDRPGMTDLLSASGGLRRTCLAVAMGTQGRRRIVARLILAVSAGSVGICLFLNASAATEENTVWTKYDNTTPGDTNTTSTAGRIPLGTSGKGDTKNAYYPAVIKDGSIYKMWYSGQTVTPSYCRIYYATSTDGLTWTKYNNTVPTASNTTGTDGRIPLGESGGDDTQVLYPAVIKVGSTYKMWYTGADGLVYRIYHATSSNGLTWLKYTNAVPPGASDTTNWGKGRIPLGKSGQGDDEKTYYPTVILDDSIYKMWYSGHDGANIRIYHATSSDGLNWTKYSNSVPDASNTTGTHGRIPLGESGGDSKHVYYPAVIKVGSTYKMWYTGHDGTNTRIFYAFSPDGLTWTKCTNAVPDDSDTTSTLGRIPLGETAGRGDTAGVNAACVIKEGLIQEGYTYKMWYGGSDGNTRIYHATCKQPPVPCTIFYSH